MSANVGESDQVVRLMVGTILLTMAATGQLELWGWVTGILTLISGTFGFCAVYALFGINTCRKGGDVSSS